METSTSLAVKLLRNDKLIYHSWLKVCSATEKTYASWRIEKLRASHRVSGEELKPWSINSSWENFSLPVESSLSPRGDDRFSPNHLRGFNAWNCYHVLSIESLKRFIAHSFLMLFYDKLKAFFMFCWMSPKAMNGLNRRMCREAFPGHYRR